MNDLSEPLINETLLCLGNQKWQFQNQTIDSFEDTFKCQKHSGMLLLDFFLSMSEFLVADPSSRCLYIEFSTFLGNVVLKFNLPLVETSDRVQ